MPAPRPLRFDVRWIDSAHEPALGPLRAFARDQLFDRAALHADLEAPAHSARSRILTATWEGRLVGAASCGADGPKGAVALAAALPGAAAALVGSLERPCRVRAPQRCWSELARAGGRRVQVDCLLVRLRPAALPERDPRVEPLSDSDALAELAELGLPPHAPGSGPWLGLRADAGRLVSAGGIAWQTGSLACVAGVATRPGERGRGFGTAVAAELVRALETPQRRVLAWVPERDLEAIRFASRLHFRGARRFGWFELGAG